MICHPLKHFQKHTRSLSNIILVSSISWTKATKRSVGFLSIWYVFFSIWHHLGGETPHRGLDTVSPRCNAQQRVDPYISDTMPSSHNPYTTIKVSSRTLSTATSTLPTTFTTHQVRLVIRLRWRSCLWRRRVCEAKDLSNTWARKRCCFEESVTKGIPGCRIWGGCQGGRQREAID